MLETMTPILRLFPPAKLRACRLGWYFSSSTAFITRARVEFLTSRAPLRTRETVAVETLARRATSARLMNAFHCTLNLGESKHRERQRLAIQKALALDSQATRPAIPLKRWISKKHCCARS